MLADQALNTIISPLTVADTVARALELMDKEDVNTLPVVNPATNKLTGQVKRKALEALDHPETSISEVELEEPVKIYQRQHIFEGVRLMLQYELRLLPVVNEEMVFLGIIQKQQLLESITDMLNLASYGSILTIELGQKDFTLSEIVHLIETEGAKILGITVETPTTEGDTFKVSVKINLEDASRITAALRRYDYDVVTDNVSGDIIGLDMKARASELLKYLDM